MTRMMRANSSRSAKKHAMNTTVQRLTLVHFSAQCTRFLWDKGHLGGV